MAVLEEFSRRFKLGSGYSGTDKPLEIIEVEDGVTDGDGMANKSSANFRLGVFSFFLFTIISIVLANFYLIDQHLSADGAFLFQIILDRETFTHGGNYFRIISVLLTQWPIVFLVKCGVTDLASLKLAYAFGLYFPYAFSFLLCVRALRGRNLFLLIFPILSMVVINLNISYMLISEAHVMACLSWPVLFLLCRIDDTRADKILLVFLLVIYSRTYESVVATSFIFLWIIVIRCWFLKNRKEPVFHLLLITICLITFVMSFYAGIHPSAPENKKSFLRSIISVYASPQLYIPVLFIVLLIFALLKKNAGYRLALFIPIFWYALVLLTHDHGLSQYASFSTRVTSLSLLPLLLAACFILSFGRFRHDKAVLLACFLFVSVVSSGHIRYSKDWKSFKSSMVQVLQQNSGFVRIEQTELNNSKCAWSWNNPELSVIWSGGCVKSIILNKPGFKWQAYDPEKELILKRYVKYDSFFRGIDNSISTCSALPDATSQGSGSK